MTRCPLFVVAAAFLAMPVVCWLAAGENTPAPPRGEANTARAVEDDGAPAASARVADDAAPAAERRELQPDEPPPPPEPDWSSLDAGLPVAPWLARFVVVDADEAPVAGATVTLRFATIDRRIQGAAPLELCTDPNGRAQTMHDAACVFVEAHKEGAGCSEQICICDPSREQTLQLVMPVPLRGIVLDRDGLPAMGAEVRATVLGSRRAARPSPVTTAVDGRFEIPLHRLVAYDVVARIGDRWSFSNRVCFADRPPDQTLTFPGAFLVSAVVVDRSGTRVEAAEVAWHVFQGSHPSQSDVVRTDGRFYLPCRCPGRTLLMARKENEASKLVCVETTAARPQAEVRLELLPLATIRGRIVSSDGSPCAGAHVSAEPEAEAGWPPDIALPWYERFCAYGVNTGADGSFELRVHPEPTWTLGARPCHGNRFLRARRTNVRSGSDGVVLHIADAASCVVHGSIERADGQPLGLVDFAVIECGAGRSEGWVELSTTIDGHQFTCEPLTVGRPYTIAVRPVDRTLAPVRVGPFWTDRADVRIHVRLQPWGEVPVRTVAWSGAPALRVWVRTEAHVPPIEGRHECGGSGGKERQPIGPGGCLRLQELEPGEHTLFVHDDQGVVCQHALHVAPGLNPPVVVRLPPPR